MVDAECTAQYVLPSLVLPSVWMEARTDGDPPRCPVLQLPEQYSWEVQYRRLGPAAGSGGKPGEWRAQEVASGGLQAEVAGLESGTKYSFRARPVLAAAAPGEATRRGEWSGEAQLCTTGSAPRRASAAGASGMGDPAKKQAQQAQQAQAQRAAEDAEATAKARRRQAEVRLPSGACGRRMDGGAQPQQLPGLSFKPTPLT